MKSFMILLLAIAELTATNTNDQKKNRQRDLLTSDLNTVSKSYNPSKNHAKHFSGSGTSKADDSLADPLVSAYPFGMKYDQRFHKENANNIVSKRATLSQPAGLVSSVNMLPILAHGKTKRFALSGLEGTSGRNVQFLPPSIPPTRPTPKTTHFPPTLRPTRPAYIPPLTTPSRSIFELVKPVLGGGY